MKMKNIKLLLASTLMTAFGIFSFTECKCQTDFCCFATDTDMCCMDANNRTSVPSQEFVITSYGYYKIHIDCSCEGGGGCETQQVEVMSSGLALVLDENVSSTIPISDKILYIPGVPASEQKSNTCYIDVRGHGADNKPPLCAENPGQITPSSSTVTNYFTAVFHHPQDDKIWAKVTITYLGLIEPKKE